MTLFEFNCRNLYYDYQEGRYNSAELIYFVCHTLKSYGFYHHEVKSLMNIIRNSVKEARWREDLDVYYEWSRHTRCCFLAQFDPSDFRKTEELVTVEGSPIIVDYRPVDVMNAINRQWILNPHNEYMMQVENVKYGQILSMTDSTKYVMLWKLKEDPCIRFARLMEQHYLMLMWRIHL